MENRNDELRKVAEPILAVYDFNKAWRRETPSNTTHAPPSPRNAA